MATAIGVIGSAITIFNFATDLFPSPDTNNVMYRLVIGNDGATGPYGGVLSNAGGNKPDVRAWDPTGQFLGIETNDNNKCNEGNRVCDTKIDGVNQTPDYTLFTANNDALCISVAKTTYPDNIHFACTIGNWAHSCGEYHGVDAAHWFYSDQTVKRQDGGADTNVKCAWIDANGDQPATGIQIHWPDFASQNQGGRSSADYCNAHPTLFWHTDDDPSYVVRYGRKRNMFAEKPSTIDQSPAAPSLRERSARSLSNSLAQKLVRSYLPEQSASELCGARNSAGPSFVSYEERAFCFMPTKTVFPFCEDVALGACWSDELQIVTPKLVDVLVPQMNFTLTAVWENTVLVE